MLKTLWFACSLALTIVSSQQPPPVVEFRPPPPPEQPIAYSHATHVALGLTCLTCHAGAPTSARASLPDAAACLTCHSSVKTESPEIQKLAGFQTRREPIPWARAYRVPEFVYFEHVRHVGVAPDITCETCHGPVADMAVMQKVRDTSMAACVQCHTERAAPTRCDTCHEPRG